MSHRPAARLLTVLLTLVAGCVSVPAAGGLQNGASPGDPPKSKPSSEKPSVEAAAPDAPLPDLGTLPKASEKPAKSAPARIARRVKDAAPRCMDAILHVCWAQPPTPDSPGTADPADTEYLKDLDVADFYLKTKNYRAAEMRYRDALAVKAKGPEATFKLALTLERIGKTDQARCGYEAFLRLGSDLPFSANARKALERLGPAKSGAANCP